MNESLSRQLDAIRGLAAVVVLVAHLNQILVLPYVGIKSTGALIFGIAASSAVVVFFFLSGFVITHSIIHNYSTRGYFSVRHFIINRISRIYPPLVFSLALGAAIFAAVWYFNLHGAVSFATEETIYVAREKFSFDFGEHLATIFMVHRVIPGWKTVSMNGPLWTIAPEFWMYILAALTCCAYLKAEKRVALSILAALVFATLFHSIDLLRFLGLMWSCGSAAAIAMNRRVSLHRSYIVLASLASLFLAVIVATLKDSSFRLYGSIMDYGIQASVSVSFLLMYCAFWNKIQYIDKFSWMGRFSYTLYVCHFPMGLLAFSLSHEIMQRGTLLQKGAIFIGSALSIIAFSAAMAPLLENKAYFSKKINTFLMVLHGYSILQFFQKIYRRTTN